MKFAKFLLTPPICAISAALLGVCAANAAVYLKPLASGETREVQDGKSWSTAYKTLPEAIAALKELSATLEDRTLYVAQGVYTITGSSSDAAILAARTIDCIALYGGYKAESDEDLPGPRDAEVWQTIFTAKSTSATWSHCEPVLGQFKFKSTSLSEEPVIKDGKINYLPFDGEYDWYDAGVASDNVAAPMLRVNGTGGIIDGVAFVGAGRVNGTANSGMANCLEVSSGYTSMVVTNCAFVANHPTQGCLNLAAPATGGAGLITGCRFYGNGYQYSSGTSVVRVSAGVTMAGCDVSGNSKGNNGYAHSGMIGNAGVVTNCVITHNSYCFATKNNVCSSALGGGSGMWIDCVISNNLASYGYSGNDGGRMPLMHFSNGGSLRRSLVANNWLECKPADGLSHAMFGVAGSSTSSSQLVTYDSCLFVSNSLVAPTVAATSGTYGLGLIGGYHSKSGYVLKNTVTNCQFEGNIVDVPAVEGVTPYLSRGILICEPTASTTTRYSDAVLSHCAFKAAHQEGVYDIVQYGVCTTHKSSVADSVFTEDDAEVNVNSFLVDDTACLSVANCTIKNMLPEYYPADFDITDGLYYDDIPFERVPFLFGGADTGYDWCRPAAKTPGIRETTDGSVRGAVNELSETAENGCTLTIRRAPFTGGTVDIPVQAVEAGGAIASVTATPVEGGSFGGWLTENGETYSTANPLVIGALNEDLVLTASFATRKTTITFDLNGAGIFDVCGERVTNIVLAAGNTFPEIPTYTVEDGKYLWSWDEMPPAVPNEDVVYRAHWVTKDLRSIYVAPGGTGDGTSWESPYGDLATAYADAGRYRGEVLMKGGEYAIAVPVAVLSNVCVRGGMDGVETVLNGAGTTYHAFLGEAGEYPNCAFSNLTFRAFGRSAVRIVGTDGTVAVTGCRFIGCNSRKEDGYTALDVNGQLELRDSAFTNNYRAAKLVNKTAVTNLIAGCDFFASTGGCTQVTLVKGSKIDVRGCTFRKNRCASSSAESNAGLRIACGSEVPIDATVEDCIFQNNTACDSSSVLATGGVFGGAVRIVRCEFSGNGYASTNPNSKGVYSTTTYASMGCFIAGKTSYTLVKDCSFLRNVGECKTSSGYGISSAVACSGAGYVTLINCTMASNDVATTMTAPAAATVLEGTSNGKLAIVNCTFDGNRVAAAGAAGAEIVDWSKTNTMYFFLINSILHSEEAGYRPLHALGNSTVRFANSIVSNYSREDIATSDYDVWGTVWTGDPCMRDGLVVGTNGVTAVELRGDTPARNRGYDVWCNASAPRVCVRFPEETADRRWLEVGRNTRKTDAKAKSDWNLSLSTPLAPDAWGRLRRRARVALGALNAPPTGLMLLVR